MEKPKKFEAAVYNQEVRRLVQEGSKHRNLDDEWADMHYIEVRANDIHGARAKVEARFAEDAGYVIDSISAVDGDE